MRPENASLTCGHNASQHRETQRASEHGYAIPDCCLAPPAPSHGAALTLRPPTALRSCCAHAARMLRPPAGRAGGSWRHPASVGRALPQRRGHRRRGGGAAHRAQEGPVRGLRLYGEPSPAGRRRWVLVAGGWWLVGGDGTVACQCRERCAPPQRQAPHRAGAAVDDEVPEAMCSSPSLHTALALPLLFAAGKSYQMFLYGCTA